jgi:hypothetical protein
MLAEIAENRLFEFISIKHLAEINDGEIRTDAPRANALENYTFVESEGTTTVSVDVDMTEEFSDYMSEAWPKSLLILKELCEVPFGSITVAVSVYAPIETVWEKWNTPSDITHRNSGHPDRHTTYAENDLRVN